MCSTGGVNSQITPCGEDSGRGRRHSGNMTSMQDSAPGSSPARDGVFGAVLSGETYRSWAYLFIGLPLGVTWFSLLLPLYLTSAILVVVWIGIGMLALTQLLSRWIGHFERWLANSWLHAHATRPDPVPAGTMWERGRALLSDEFGYRSLLWSFVRVFTGTLGFVLAVVAFVVPISLTVAPISYIWESDIPGQWEWTLWVAPLLGIPAFIGAAHLVRACGRASARLAELVLGTSNTTVDSEAEARARRAEEQVRIDQELHDSIGHVLTMNVVQAGAGAHVFDTDPEFARSALTNIEQRGRTALSELDRIIAMVRDGDVARAPLHSWDDLPDLIAETRSAGIQVEATTALATPPSPEVGRTVYRVVQEALTNVAKHAPAAQASVTVTRVNGSVRVEVRDDGAGTGASLPGSGTGLAGIHDRVSLMGGTSDAGPMAGGGFRVVAEIPDSAEMS